MRIRNYFPLFKDEGEMIAGFGEAKLLRFLDGKYELRGGSKEDRLAAHEWISLFCHDVVVKDERKHDPLLLDLGRSKPGIAG
jgi:hypothetical protein